MSTPNNDQSKLTSIKTYMLVAFIFGLIATILFVIAGILEFVSYASLAAYYAGYVNPEYYNLYIAPSLSSIIAAGIALIVIGAIGLYIFFFRIRPMYNASKAGDIAKLKSLNNMLWAILCLIFTGVIPGIMMLIAFGPINELGNATSTPPPPPPPPPS